MIVVFYSLLAMLMPTYTVVYGATQLLFYIAAPVPRWCRVLRWPLGAPTPFTAMTVVVGAAPQQGCKENGRFLYTLHFALCLHLLNLTGSLSN